MGLPVAAIGSFTEGQPISAMAASANKSTRAILFIYPPKIERSKLYPNEIKMSISKKCQFMLF
jgi:hypothetical protein